MKMFYTQLELSQIGAEELMELTTFGGENNHYYYSDLEKINEDGEEYSFTFKDKSIIYTQDIEVFNNVKIGKSRYDMLSKSLEANEDTIKREAEFLQKIQESVQEQIYAITTTSRDSISQLNNSVSDFKNSTKNLIDETEKKVDSTLETVGSRLDKTAKDWTKKMKTLEVYDVEAYNVKMEKMDKLIDMFTKLLEDA